MKRTLSASLRREIKSATVTIHKGDSGHGCGFLVPGGMIVTAAHCVDLSALADWHTEDPLMVAVTVAKRKSFLVELISIDPVCDIAVFGPADNQVFWDDCEAFEVFSEETKALSLLSVPSESFPRGGETPVFLRTHVGKWISGTMCAHAMNGHTFSKVTVHTDGGIPFGTSGSPIVDAAGRVVAVVSLTTGSSCEGLHPYIHSCLPRFLSTRIEVQP